MGAHLNLIGAEYAKRNTSEIEDTSSVVEMCKNNTRICSKCLKLVSKWEECRELPEYRNKTGNPNMEIESNEWMDAHGRLNPPMIEFDIVLTLCPTCKNANRPKAEVTKIVKIIDTHVKPFAGLFTIMNSSGNRIMTPWVKRNRDPIVSDVETETETETGDENGHENVNADGSATETEDELVTTIATANKDVIVGRSATPIPS